MNWVELVTDATKKSNREIQKMESNVENCGTNIKDVEIKFESEVRKSKANKSKKQTACKLLYAKLNNRLTCDCLCGNGQGPTESKWIDSCTAFFNSRMELQYQLVSN